MERREQYFMEFQYYGSTNQLKAYVGGNIGVYTDKLQKLYNFCADIDKKVVLGIITYKKLYNKIYNYPRGIMKIQTTKLRKRYGKTTDTFNEGDWLARVKGLDTTH